MHHTLPSVPEFEAVREGLEHQAREALLGAFAVQEYLRVMRDVPAALPRSPADWLALVKRLAAAAGPPASRTPEECLLGRVIDLVLLAARPMGVREIGDALGMSLDEVRPACWEAIDSGALRLVGFRLAAWTELCPGGRAGARLAE